MGRVIAALYELDFLFNNVPCFATNPQSMVFELNRCTFMTAGDRKDTIELLALVAAHYNDLAADKLSPVLGSLLQQKASTLIADYFSSGGSSPTYAKTIVHTITKAVPKTSGNSLFSPVVLHAFVSSVAQAVTRDNTLRYGYYVDSADLSKFLSFSDMFQVVLGWSFASPHNRKALQDSPLHQLLRTCLAAIQQLAADLSDQSIRLATLHVVVSKSTQALALFDLARKYSDDTASVSAAHLAAIRAELAKFDQDLKAVQCFMTTFCNCGVPTKVDDLQSRIEELTRDYDTLEVRLNCGSIVVCVLCVCMCVCVRVCVCVPSCSCCEHAIAGHPRDACHGALGCTDAPNRRQAWRCPGTVPGHSAALRAAQV